MRTYYNVFYRLLFSAMLTIPLISNAQITFNRFYHTLINQDGMDVIQTPDEGYLIASITETAIINDLDIRLIKTNKYGDTLWSKVYGGARPDFPNRIIPTSDGNYFIVGYTQSAGSGDSDNLLLKVDPSGNLIFSKVYGGYGNEDGKEIVATADGNYVIVGATNSISFSDNDIELIKIDLAGTALWTKYYGTTLNNYESARSVKLCPDGGFIIAGKTFNSTTTIASIYLVKTNSAGDTLWTRKVAPGSDSYEGKSIIANADSTYTLAADDSSATNDSDVRIMKFSKTGALLLNKMYGGTDKDVSKMIQPTSDGGYIVAGISRSFGWIKPDMWLLKLDVGLDTMWSQHYGGAEHEHCYSAKQTMDGGYIAVGHSWSHNISKIDEIMLVKLNSSGLLTSISEPSALNNPTLNLYPNPSTGTVEINIEGDLSYSTFRISNTLGQVVYTEDIKNVTKREKKIIDLKDNKPGIYFVTIQSKNGITTKKLILY